MFGFKKDIDILVESERNQNIKIDVAKLKRI